MSRYSQSNDSGREGNYNDVSIDIEGVKGNWEPENMQKGVGPLY